MNKNDDMRRIMLILIREIRVNLCPIFEVEADGVNLLRGGGSLCPFSVPILVEYKVWYYEGFERVGGCLLPTQLSISAN